MLEERAEEAKELAKQAMGGFDDPVSYAQDLVQKEADRRIEMCKRVVKRMLKHQLCLAWNEFVESVFTVKENRETVKRVLARM